MNIVIDQHKEYIALMRCMFQKCIIYMIDDLVSQNIIHNTQKSLLYVYESIASS